METLKKIGALFALILIVGGAICSLVLSSQYGDNPVPVIASILLSLAAVPTEIYLVRYLIGK